MKYSKPVRIRSVYPNQPEVISSFIFNFNSKVNENDCKFDGVRNATSHEISNELFVGSRWFLLKSHSDNVFADQGSTKYRARLVRNNWVNYSLNIHNNWKYHQVTQKVPSRDPRSKIAVAATCVLVDKKVKIRW